MKISHYVLTRLNIGLYLKMKYDMDRKDTFTRNRILSYKNFGLPSILAQTRDVTPVLLVDILTPPAIKKDLERELKNDRLLILWDDSQRPFEERDSIAMYSSWYKEYQKLVADSRTVLTTRLDSDDWLLPSFCEAIYRNVSRPFPQIIDMQKYVVMDTGRIEWLISSDHKPPSEVSTMAEDGDKVLTPYWYTHRKIGRVSEGMAVEQNGVHWVKEMDYTTGKYKRLMDTWTFNRHKRTWSTYQEAMADKLFVETIKDYNG